MSTPQKRVRRQIFVFTPDEKRAAACVVGAFLLGLGTMYYRAAHSRPSPAPSAAEQREAKKAASRARSGRPPSPPARTPAAARGDVDERAEEE
jgi:hypothetical protein